MDRPAGNCRDMTPNISGMVVGHRLGHARHRVLLSFLLLLLGRLIRLVAFGRHQLLREERRRKDQDGENEERVWLGQVHPQKTVVHGSSPSGRCPDRLAWVSSSACGVEPMTSRMAR